MSVKIMGMVFDANLPRDEKYVLLSYADHAAHDGTSIYPSVERMAWKMGYSIRSVQTITRKLVERGILIDDGRGPSNVNRWRIDVTKLPQRSAYQSTQGANSAPCKKQHEGVQISTSRGANSAPNPSLSIIESSHFAQGASETSRENLEEATTAQEPPQDTPPPYRCKHCGDLADVDKNNNPDTQGQYSCLRCGDSFFINEQPITQDDITMMDYLGWHDELIRLKVEPWYVAQEERCPDCDKPLCTSEQTPRLKDCCICRSTQVVIEAFGARTREPTMPPTHHYTERANDPWLELSDGRFKPRSNASIPAMDHVLWLICEITGKWPTSSQWKHWNTQCGEIYEAGGGDWDAIEQGIVNAWQRGPRYRPQNIRGFVDPVSNAFADRNQVGLFGDDEIPMV